MRCNNCGWDNQDNMARCEKCNAPLKGSMVQHNGATPAEPSNEEIAGTVKGHDANLPYLDNPAMEQKEEKSGLNQDSCLSCGYPVNKDAIKCPNCHKVLDHSYTGKADPIKKEMSSGTVSPWQQAKYSSCSFKPIARENEKDFQDLEFTGDEVILNRDNLEQDNMTITSKQQALLINKDGKWYIVDRSSMQTTFIHIKEPTELKDGDTLLFGDRKFEFKG